VGESEWVATMSGHVRRALQESQAANNARHHRFTAHATTASQHMSSAQQYGPRSFGSRARLASHRMRFTSPGCTIRLLGTRREDVPEY
jgi:hypothetical protein